MNLLVALMRPLISTTITPNKIIAGVVLLIVILALVAWYMSRRRGPS